MDKKLYEQLLSEVAEWTVPKLSATDIREAKKRGRGRPTNESIYEEQNLLKFLEQHGGVNPTYPPELKKLKCQGHNCQDCGEYCPNGRHTEKKMYEANRTRHWREKCVTCNKFKNPLTGEFDLDPSIASHKWNQFLRDTKGAYKTKRNTALAETTAIIRKYPDTEEPL